MAGDTCVDLGKQGTARVMANAGWGDGFGSLQHPQAEDGVTGEPQGQGQWLRWDPGTGGARANERHCEDRLFWCHSTILFFGRNWGKDKMGRGSY